MSQERNGGRSRVVAVAGAKGGVGKTTTAINLAAGLAEAGFRTVVLDLDLVMANVLDFLDLDMDEAEDPTAHEVLADEASLEDATYEAPGGMDVVPSGPSLEGYVKTDLGNMAVVIQRLKQDYDYVVIDTGAGVSRQNVEPLGGADEVLLVSTPRIAAIRDARKTIKLVDRSGGSVRGLVLTKSGTGRSPGPERISEFLGVPLLEHVEEDEAIPDSQDRGVPVVVSAPDSPAGESYRDLAATLVAAHEEGREPAARPFEDETDIESLTAAMAESAEGREGSAAAPDPLEGGDGEVETDAAESGGGASGETASDAAASGEAASGEAASGETASEDAASDEAETGFEFLDPGDDREDETDQARSEEEDIQESGDAEVRAATRAAGPGTDDGQPSPAEVRSAVQSPDEGTEDDSPGFTFGESESAGSSDSSPAGSEDDAESEPTPPDTPSDSEAEGGPASDVAGTGGADPSGESAESAADRPADAAADRADDGESDAVAEAGAVSRSDAPDDEDADGDQDVDGDQDGESESGLVGRVMSYLGSN